MSRVKFEKKSIVIDGVPRQILSGAVHYFRVPEELWEDRLRKAAQCGLNCIETYLCWNLHEPEEGRFDFSGMLNLGKFIRTAAEQGLYVIVRPGPYICAEWDNGGIPAWLMTRPGIEFRRMNTPYLEAVERYYRAVLPILAELQYDAGGPVIAVQVENEYGSYGHDKEYLATLRRFCREGGITVPLFTADGAADLCIVGGMLEDSPMTLTFGSRGLEAFALGRRFRPEDPSFCMEFWDGWFDAWGCGKHHDRSPQEVADEFDDMIRAGGSVNFYMFHGGTNFSFWNGANGVKGGVYTPDTTSYDYDAPLSECGDPTEKYFLIRDVIRKHFPDVPTGTPEPSRKADYGKVPLLESAPFFPNLDAISEKTVVSVSTKTMEELGQNFGFIHYRTRIAGPVRCCDLHLWEVHDRAIVYLDGKQHFIYYRNDASCCAPVFSVPEAGVQLDILVENMGRINYGPLTGRDFKGIVDGVTTGNQFQFDWEIRSLPMENRNLSRLSFQPFLWNDDSLPSFHRAFLEIPDEPADTFLQFPGVKGVVWVNGHNLGRYWNIGPGGTLYVPAPWLKKGKNEILVFELEKLKFPYLRFLDRHQL